MPVTIIAEAGCNHDGNLDKALALCDAAKEAGADIVKFQTFVPEKLLRSGHPRMEAARKLALSFADTLKVAHHCEALGIEFCSTPDDLDSLKFLVEECGVKRIKIGSGSLMYRPLVDAAFDTGLPILLSTGMATLDEVWDVIYEQRDRESHKHSVNSLTLMHCVSLYPCPPELANVKAINDLSVELEGAWAFSEFHVGYSDHTAGWAVSSAAAAVALGATVIEKHFTINPFQIGASPDHPMSASPLEFKRLVNAVREIETVLGDGHKQPSDEERAMIPRLRKDAEGFQPEL